MVSAKLSALTELAATPASTDEVYVRDVSEAAVDESKRITIANLMAFYDALTATMSNKTINGAIVAASNLILNDSQHLRLGTGGDSRLYYNGTDTFWDLRAVGTGDLMIALAGSFPSPDPNSVHIWRGTAGAISANANAPLVLEAAGASYLQPWVTL